MTKLILRLLGWLLLAAGFVVVALPIASVARLTGEVLDEVPAVSGVEVHEDRNVLSALWAEDFQLAERIYPAGVSIAEAIEAMGDDFDRGFIPDSIENARSKTCCGDYDAVLVGTSLGDDGRVRQTLSVFDSDVQAAFGLIAFLGLLISMGGVGLLVMVAAESEAPRTASTRRQIDRNATFSLR